MAGYSYKPQKTDSGTKASDKAKANHFDSMPKSKMYVAMALVLFSLMIIGGSSITGKLVGIDPEYEDLSKLPDFPDLSKQSANVAYYKCTNELETSEAQYEQCSSGLANIKTAYDSCMTDTNRVSTELQEKTLSLNSCTSESQTFKSERDQCVTEKSNADTTLNECEGDLSDAHSTIASLENQRLTIIANYAKQVCCIQKQFQPSLGYYHLENNKIICTDDSDDEEFDCD